MKTIIYPIIATALTLSAHARDIRFEDCPAGVRQSIEAKLEGGRIDDIESVILNGKTRYIVDIDGPGRRDLTLRLSPAGRILIESEDFTLKQCPTKVRNAIQQAVAMKAGWSIDDIDQVTNSKGVRFHVDIDRRGQRDLKLVISSNGNVIKREVERFD